MRKLSRKLSFLFVRSVGRLQTALSGDGRRSIWLLPAFALLLVFLAVAGGCSNATAPMQDQAASVAPPDAPDALTVMMIDEAVLGDLIARHWFAETGGTITILNKNSAEVADPNFELPRDVDALIYPTGMLGDLESRKMLVPFSRKTWLSEEYNKDELLRIFRTSIPRHHNETWGVPLGGPMFTVVFDQSLADSLPAGVPNNWLQFLELVEKKRSAPDSDFKFRMPLAKGWAAQVLLLRAAPLIRSRGRLSTVFERSNMQPLIHSTPFLLALHDIQALMGEDTSQLQLTPAELFSEIAQGQTTMGFTWPAPPAVDDAEEQAAHPVVELGFASLPGTSQWYDLRSNRWMQRSESEATHYDLYGFSGLIGSAAANSRNVEGVFSFLAWLGNKSTPLRTLVYSPLSGPFRASHLGNPSLWGNPLLTDDGARRFADVVSANHQRDLILMFPRIPHRDEYLMILDDSVREFLSGNCTAEECLENVANRWNELTDQLDRDRMIQELAKDSGL
jgi:multiple sugar transport system substrate-binding protein